MQNYLIALALAGIVDAISYMVVTPSIIFYVLQNGGTKEQYGIILSAFSFASFLTKPVLGGWSDRRGFRVPYISSLIIATTGGALYLAASALPPGKAAVGMILASRLLGGVGAANSALGFAYIAQVTPQKEQTSVNSLLSMVRILGMTVGPGVNVLIAWVDMDLFGGAWKLDPLNSVGIILILTNLLAILTVFFLLEEPKPDISRAHSSDEVEEHVSSRTGSDSESNRDSTLELTDLDSIEYTNAAVFRAIISPETMVPLLSIFAFNAAFQLVETGFAPAAAHALGWGPVNTSGVLGSVSLIIMVDMFFVQQLSSRFEVSDMALLCFGHVLSTVGYSSLFGMWKMGAEVWQFVLPVVVGAGSFPFMAAPTRSIFTQGVSTKPALNNFRGTMQALLSMGASIAGFLTPGFVAKYCLRHSDEVEASSDGREMSVWSLFAPFLSIVTLAGLGYMHLVSKPHVDDQGAVLFDSLTTDEEKLLSETSDLLMSSTKRRTSASAKETSFRISSRVAVHRQSACSFMGITQPSYEHMETISSNEN